MALIEKKLLHEELDGLRQHADVFADRLVKGALVGTDPVAPRSFQAAIGTVMRHPDIRLFIEGASSDDGDVFNELIDPALVRRAQSFFVSDGLSVLATLLMAALPECYAAGRGAQVLYLTGELTSHPARRVGETLQLLLTMLTPDPQIPVDDRGRLTTLHPGQRGAVTARRIRIFHAITRQLFVDHGPLRERWASRHNDFEKSAGPPLGVPLCQEDLLGTHLLFSAGTLEHLHKVGTHPRARDIEAWMHVWDIVGRHLGVGVSSALAGSGSQHPGRDHGELGRSGHLPVWSHLEYEGGLELLEIIRARHRTPTFEGKVLINALLREVEGPLPRSAKSYPSALVRYLAGGEVADVLGVRRSKADFYLSRVRSFSRVQKSLDRGVGRVATVAGGELAASMMRGSLQMYIDQGRLSRADPGQDFNAYGPLCRAWGLRSEGSPDALEVPLAIR